MSAIEHLRRPASMKPQLRKETADCPRCKKRPDGLVSLCGPHTACAIMDTMSTFGGGDEDPFK